MMIKVSNSETFCYSLLMKEIIWVYGTSASGKETFIRKLINNDELKKLLKVENVPIAMSNNSLIHLGKLDDSRLSILSEAAELLKVNNTVVIKWQYGDSLLDSPNVLRNKFPNYKHTVIILNTDRSEQIRRLRTKMWWHDDGKEDEFIIKELSIVDKSIKKLDDGFNVINFDW